MWNILSYLTKKTKLHGFSPQADYTDRGSIPGATRFSEK
jgi:hypothetical protein